MSMIDFRSDTTTKPTMAMRQAMFDAEVGDDVYQDDPTVQRLELLAAKMTGMEAALFVVSGTMGNQVAIMTHTQPQEEVIVGYNHHAVTHEVGAMAALSGVSIRTLYPTIEKPQHILDSIREENIHFPKTSLVALENALSNGLVVSLEDFQACIKIAKQHHLKVHVDGARIFNAAEALGVSVATLIAGADSMMFCLSKGLGAPIGSMLVGSKDFIEKARKNRKMVGGGWRQAGIVAAAGIVALTSMVNRLKEDHDHAKWLHHTLKDMDCIQINDCLPMINMVFFKFEKSIDDADYVLFLKHNGILISPSSRGVYRLVTHLNVSFNDLEKFIYLTKEYIQKNRE